MRLKMITCVLAVALLSAIGCSATDENEEKKKKSRKMAARTLQDLCKLDPPSQAAIQKSAGYAVFSNTGVNLLLSTAGGSGIALNSKTKQETFMKMVSAGAGLDVGVKDYRVIFAFDNDKAFIQILDSGWSGSAQKGRCRKGWREGRSLLGSGRGCPGCMGLSDQQEWPRPPIDLAGHEILQGRRP
jgi:lipid-binding SYLF domain-containing protein